MSIPMVKHPLFFSILEKEDLKATEIILIVRASPLPPPNVMITCREDVRKVTQVKLFKWLSVIYFLDQIEILGFWSMAPLSSNIEKPHDRDIFWENGRYVHDKEAFPEFLFIPAYSTINCLTDRFKRTGSVKEF